jgi:hypothetical protein
MGRKRMSEIKESAFTRVDEVVVGNRTILRGETIKIDGEHGGKFKFHSLVTNTITGSQWIDCFELHKSVVSGWRSFRTDRIKPIPIKRGRRKNVN